MDAASIAPSAAPAPTRVFYPPLPFRCRLRSDSLADLPRASPGRVDLGHLWSACGVARDDVGHLRPGARADLVILDAPSHVHLAYRPGVPLVRRVITSAEAPRAAES